MLDTGNLEHGQRSIHFGRGGLRVRGQAGQIHGRRDRVQRRFPDRRGTPEREIVLAASLLEAGADVVIALSRRESQRRILYFSSVPRAVRVAVVTERQAAILNLKLFE